MAAGLCDSERAGRVSTLEHVLPPRAELLTAAVKRAEDEAVLLTLRDLVVLVVVVVVFLWLAYSARK